MNGIVEVDQILNGLTPRQEPFNDPRAIQTLRNLVIGTVTRIEAMSADAEHCPHLMKAAFYPDDVDPDLVDNGLVLLQSTASQLALDVREDLTAEALYDLADYLHDSLTTRALRRISGSVIANS